MSFDSLVTILEQEHGPKRIHCYDKMHKRIVIDKKCHFSPFKVEQMVNYIKDDPDFQMKIGEVIDYPFGHQHVQTKGSTKMMTIDDPNSLFKIKAILKQ
jgi:transcription elongation factor GreA-like protein